MSPKPHSMLDSLLCTRCHTISKLNIPFKGYTPPIISKNEIKAYLGTLPYTIIIHIMDVNDLSNSITRDTITWFKNDGRTRNIVVLNKMDTVPGMIVPAMSMTKVWVDDVFLYNGGTRVFTLPY